MSPKNELQEKVTSPSLFGVWSGHETKFAGTFVADLGFHAFYWYQILLLLAS